MADFNEQIIAEFRENDGTVETAGFGRGLVLVHHFGTKSGQERSLRSPASLTATTHG